MAFPESLLILAGFAFAHATWSVSDLPEGELLAPLAIVEIAGQRQLLRFEAETQAEAIAQGKTTLKEQEVTFDAWAFAREGEIQESDKNIAVLTIEAKARGMPESVLFVQRFRPFSSGRFQLIGEPIVSVGGKEASDKVSEQLISQLKLGIQSHGDAAILWDQWKSP